MLAIAQCRYLWGGRQWHEAVLQFLQELYPRTQLRYRNQADDMVAATLLIKHRASLGKVPLGFEANWRLLQNVLDGREGGSLPLVGRLSRLAVTSRPHHPRRWYLRRAWRLAREAAVARNRSPWLVKEPNLQMFADRIVKSRRDLVLLVIVRSGLDMAFSRNQQQVVTWTDSGATPRASLEFWCRSHERLFEIAAQYSGRMCFLSFEKLCTRPHDAVRPIAQVLPSLDLDQLAARAGEVFRLPPSVGRHLREDTSMTPPEVGRIAEAIRCRVESGAAA